MLSKRAVKFKITKKKDLTKLGEDGEGFANQGEGSDRSVSALSAFTCLSTACSLLLYPSQIL